MCLILSLLPATVFTVLGFIVLYCATQSEGRMSTFGRFLATWVFVVAAFFPLMGAYVTIAGVCPIEALLQGMPGH